MICQTDNAAGKVYPILPRCRKSHVKEQIQCEVTCVSPFLATRCLHVAYDFRVYSHCRFQFADCPLIHCGIYVTPYRFSWTILILGLALSYRQIVGIPMDTNCAPLVADLFLFCYERDFMKNLSSDNQADVIKAFNLMSRYLDDLLNIDNPYFEGMVIQIYPPELQLNKAKTSHTEAPFLDLHPSISNCFVSSKIYDKRDDFDFDIVNFPFLDGNVPRRPSYGVYISQLIRFARLRSHVDDFNTCNA